MACARNATSFMPRPITAAQQGNRGSAAQTKQSQVGVGEVGPATAMQVFLHGAHWRLKLLGATAQTHPLQHSLLHEVHSGTKVVSSN